ncbi:MAG: hypothetical protein WKF73_07450 [Nocardioidaceae bacterium]
MEAAPPRRRRRSRASTPTCGCPAPTGDIQVAVAHKPSDPLSAGDTGSQAVAIAKDLLHLADIKILHGQDLAVAERARAAARAWARSRSTWSPAGRCRAKAGRCGASGTSCTRCRPSSTQPSTTLTYTNDALEGWPEAEDDEEVRGLPDPAWPCSSWCRCRLPCWSWPWAARRWRRSSKPSDCDGGALRRRPERGGRRCSSAYALTSGYRDADTTRSFTSVETAHRARPGSPSPHPARWWPPADGTVIVAAGYDSGYGNIGQPPARGRREHPLRPPGQHRRRDRRPVLTSPLDK